jgi:hypothetical protein
VASILVFLQYAIACEHEKRTERGLAGLLWTMVILYGDRFAEGAPQTSSG